MNENPEVKTSRNKMDERCPHPIDSPEKPWHDLSDPPTEGVKIRVRLTNGMECQAIRRGNAICVGVPDSFHPEVVQWMEEEQSQENEDETGHEGR